MSININASNYQSEVLDCPDRVLVDFWAPWCGPCQMLAPIIEELEKDLQGKIKVVKMNVDESPDIAASLNVSSIPTVLLFDKGKVINTWIGFRQKQEFLSVIG